MRALCLLVLMAAAGLAAEVKVAPEVKVGVGRLAKIEAVASDPKQIRWVNVHPDLDVIESETGRWAIVSSPKAGRYKLAAYSDAGGPPSYVVVTVEGPTPPPVPPTPVDPPAPPDEPLAAAVRVAYAKESSPLKAGQLAFLAAVFAAAAPLVDASATNADLFARLKAAIHAPGVGLPDGALPLVMAAATAPLTAALGTSPTAALDAAKAKAALAQIAVALKAPLTRKAGE